MTRFMRPSSEDSARYKALDLPEVWNTVGNYEDSEYVHDDKDLYALEHLLGRQVTNKDFGPNGALATTDVLRKLDALKARRALAEYLLRTRSFERPVNDHAYNTDANTLALLSFDPEDKLTEYTDKYTLDKYKEVMQELLNNVPETLYSSSNANDFKDAARQKARAEAEREGITYEDEYGDTVSDGVKNGKYAAWDARELNNHLHPFADEPLVTDEEKAALLNSNITSALGDLKGY